MASQSFSFDWLKEKTANLNIEIDSIELLKSCILIVGGRGLDDKKKKILVVDAVTGTVLAEFTEKQSKDAKVLRLQYLAHSEKLVYSSGTELRVLSPTVNGSYLIDAALNQHIPTSASEPVTIELPLQEAQQIVKVLKAQLNKDESEINKLGISLPELKAVVTQIEDRTASILKATSNKQLQFPTVTFTAVYSKVKAMLGALTSQLNESEVLSAANAVNETVKLSGKSFETAALAKSTTAVTDEMNAELNRLKSFTFWPRTNKHATPSNLAKAGFYHQPKVEANAQLAGQDRCVCFSCKLVVSDWTNKDHPWREHSTLKPTCAFVQGKTTNNVPLAVSLAALPAERTDVEIKSISSAPHTELILTTSDEPHNPIVTVWDTTAGLRKLYSFAARDGKLHTKKENKPTNDVFSGEKNPERDGTLIGVYLMQCKPRPVTVKPAEEKKGKWVEWCTTDIEVFVGDKGLYPGAKGLVFDLIDKETICVFLPVIGEVVNLPLSHLLPFKPKANQKVRILKGDLQGEEGVLVALQEQTGVVRLLSTKKIVTVDLNSLASMPSPEGSIEKEAEDQDIEDCCAVCLFTLDNSAAFVVYELTNKEPKFMQTYHIEGKGSATQAIYSATQQRVVVAFKHDSQVLLSSFTFDEEHRRLSEHKSQVLAHDVSDPIVKLMSIELNNSEALLLVTELGRFYCIDRETLQSIGSLAHPTDSLLLRDATFVTGDNQVVAADRQGRLLNLEVKSTIQQAVEPQQDNSAPLKIDLGPVTEENLKSLNKFQFDSIEFSSFPPPGVKQVRLQDGTRVKWRIPSDSERSEHLFEIEFTKTRTVDSLELEMGLSRAWLGIENEILGPKYMLSLSYQDYTNNKWIKALDKFDLTGLISFGDSDEPSGKLRIGSINVHFTARRLLLTLVSASRDEQNNKLSRRKMDFSKDNIKKVMSKKFDYQTDFDENGLLYWIGSNGHKEEWKNPLTSGKIKLEISHEKMYSQEMKKEDIIGRAVTQSTYWGGNCPQWFYIDLGSEYRLMCDHYTLRHGYQHANSYIQNWLFQGSNDAENWVTLHEGGETPFTKGFDTKTFHIKDGKEHFRYFRVLQKGNYSMGVGKPGGSAYICVAGFEIYGELYSGASSKPSPNSVNSLAVKFASLKPIEGKSLSDIRALRHSLFESTPFYLSLIKACEDMKTSVGLRHQCLDLLLDVWKRASDKMLSILEAINLEVFIRINIVGADKATALKAGRVLMYAVHVGQELYKKSLLIASLDVLTHAFDHCRTPGGMNQLFAMLYLCWDADRVKAHARAVKILLNLGHKLFEARSPFYNLLRTHFGLYGYPLELDLFETPSRSDKQKKTEEPLGKSAEALEQQLHIYSLEFASKRRNLTTMLEEINISGDLFASHEKDVNKAYTDCINAQIMFHRVRKHLQALKPNEHIVSSADNRLDRWTSAAERLFQCLNQQNDEFEHEEAMLQDLFTHYCVYGTPTLRREAARFLMHQLGSQVSFPSNTLRKFFCSNPEYTRPINLFPQQEVFDTLQEIMGQDRLRFFYVDDLFSMLEELTAATNVSNIDVALVSWVLLLLSNTMSLTPDKAPVHQGSKCRNCNMSPICGVRYRCVNCLDYDLCEQCESDSTAHNKSHLFLKIPTALPLPPSSFRGMPPPKDPLLPLMYAQDSSSVSPASLDEQDGYTHTGVSCDGCGKIPIKGIRYKCVHCDEFNFCETCEGKVEHYPLHLFLKIRRPVPSGATTENPKALIPVLLHRGFYPFSQFKSQSSQSFTKLSKSVTDASKMKKDSDQLSPNSLSVSSGKSLRSSAADITKFINESSDVTQAAGSVFDGRHLRSIFSVISLSARMQPLSPELFLLAMRVLEGLTNQYTPDDIYEDVFKHPKFDEFLRQVSSYPSTFIRSAVLQMVEKLCNIETYSGGKESAQAIRRIRALLRSKAIKLLLSNDNKNFSADFLLELLLVITYEQELGTKTTTEASPGPSSSAASSSQSAATATDEAESASPITVRKTVRTEDESEDYALDEIAAYLLHYLSRDNPLTASAAARPWCMVLRLLHSVDPKQLCRLPALLNVFREAILAPEELQVLLLDDFVQLASKLLATEGLGEVLQRELMGELVVTFPQVHYDTHTLLYLRLLEVMREHFTAAVHYKIEHLFALLQELAAELPDSLALAVHGASSKGNRLLQVVLDVLNTVFTAPTFTAADRAQLLDLANKQKRDKAFTTLFIQWLSNMEQSDKSVTQPTLTTSSSTAVLNTSSNTLTSSSSTLTASNTPVTASVSSSALPTVATKFDLSKSIVRLIKILSTENEGAKHFLELCLSVLRTKPTSVSIAELCLTLVRNEELAHYLIVELEGYKFLFDQIKSSNSRARSSFLAPAFANILSHSKKNNAANVTRPVKSGDKLENLSHVSELLEPKQDKLLARLLKESVIVSSCIWTYNFKRSKEVDEDKFSMTIAIPDNVILREIRIDCINNYNSTSRFPPFITVETGTSLSRLLPVGRFPCKPSALQPNPNTKYTSTFKLPLPGIEVVKFIRMHLQCPNKSAWIALSRIQLLGHSSLLYNAKEEGEDPLLTAQLPLSASLELLEHCVRHDLVQQFLAQQKETQTFALFLLQILTTKTSQAVQNILSHLAKYDVELSDKLLQQLLTGQTTCHAALAGRLCGLGDADTVNRLNRLRDFVFRELANHTATSLSSHLMPFLNALSDAISSYQRKGLAVQCVVTEAQIELLFNCAINSLEGSLMQQGSLRLLSSLIQSTPEYFQVLLNKFNASMNETAVVKAVVPQSSNRPDQNAFRTLGILASSSSLCATRLLDTGIPSRIVTVINEYAQHVDKSASVEEAQKFLEAALAFFADISHNETVKHWLGKHAFDVMFELCSRKDFGSKVHYAIQDVFRVCANLNEQNQEMIAAYLLTQLTQPNSAQMISEFMLQLMVDMFSLEDRVVICLHSLTGSSEELNLLDTSTTARTDPIRLDRKLCHPHLDLDEDQLGATANTLATTGWRTVLSEKPITSGVRRWEVILEKCTSTANIMIGVCERHQKLNAYIGQNNTAKGWSYYGATTGYTYHDGKSNSQYGQKMKEGDVIGVTLDMDEGTLAFTRNGEDLGVAFSTGLAGFELYPAVSLYDVGDRVRFRELEGPTAKQGVLWATKLNSSNPLTYQRSAPLFNVPATTTLAQLAESLTAVDPEGAVALFQLPGQPDTVLQSQLTMLELHRLVGSGSELVDLNIEIIKRDDERSVRAIKPTASGISEQVGSVLKRFADKGGLAQLVDMIDTHLQKKESTSTPSDSKTKTKETDIATWRTWLQLLRKELQVTGFVQMFVRDSDCRALLFRVMTEAQDVKAGPVRDISERLGLAAVPTPSEALLANPMQPLLSALFDLLRTSQHSVAEDSLQVRSEVMQAGVLAALLSLLTDLCDTAPRDPEHPAFSAAVDKWRSRQKDRQDKAAKAQNGSDGKFWAKGTGYGTNADDTAPVTWSHEAYVKEQTALAKKIATLLEGVQGFLAVTAEPLDHTQPALSTEAYQLIAASSLVPVLGSYLRNDSLLDMGRHFDLYTAVLKTTRALALHDALVNLADELPNQSVSLFDLLHKLHTMADVILKRLPKSRLENTAPQKKEQSSEEDEITLAIEISKTQSLVRQRVLDHRAKTVVHKQPLQPTQSSNQPLDSAKEKELAFSRLYQEQLAELQFDEILMKDDSGDYKHHYKSRIKSDTSSAPKKMKRLVQEVGSLSTGLPLFPDSSVFLRVDSDRMDVLKCVITGPKDTPYMNGFFEFDVYCPPEYPAVPPVINLQTTGNGTVRFNPNLYNCGKVCLSLLGTWRGGPNEKWNESTSTLLQVFVSIQSLILVDKPYFNEPGYESSMNTPKGEQQSRQYNEVIRLATIRWAMLEQIRNPPLGFEEVAKTHFKLKRTEIMQQCQQWIKEAKESKSPGHLDKLQKLVDELKKELQALDPNTPLELTSSDAPVTPDEKKVDEKEVKRWESALSLQDVVPGFPLALYVKALSLNQDKADLAVNWLLEKGENYLLDHAELFKAEAPKGLNEKKS